MTNTAVANITVNELFGFSILWQTLQLQTSRWMNYLCRKILGTVFGSSDGLGDKNLKCESGLKFYILKLTADEMVCYCDFIFWYLEMYPLHLGLLHPLLCRKFFKQLPNQLRTLWFRSHSLQDNFWVVHTYNNYNRILLGCYAVSSGQLSWKVSKELPLFAA